MRETTMVLMAAALVLAVGCGDGLAPLSEIDPLAAPEQPTYTEHIAPIMARYCTACHAPDAQPGEVDGYGYETCEKVTENWGGIVVTVFRTETMPPGGADRVTESDILTLERWEAQGATCE